MPAPEAAPAREPLHSRTLEIHGYKRADGLYDIEGTLTDTKPYDFPIAGGVRHAGEPVHRMQLRITVDRTLTILEAEAAMDAMPYVEHCGAIVPAYRKLVGLAIGPGYLREVKERLGGVRGCTHLTELALALATGAFQTMAGQRVQDPERKPFQIDRCHALASSAPAVARYYPRWYQGAEIIAPATEGESH